MKTTVVVADIHGQYNQLLDIISPHIGSGRDMVFLGDLIDRASTPNGDVNVLDLVHDIQQEPSKFGLGEVTVLKGNHEQMLLDAVDNDDYELWKWNGGDADALPDIEPYIDWLSRLPTMHIKSHYLFVHAGVRPNIPLEYQSSMDMIWIRDPFLKAEHHNLPYTVVHGHTPVAEIEHRNGRIACDLGSYHTGRIGTITLN